MEDLILFLKDYMSYGIISMSLCTAYCLSNKRAALGRKLGIATALAWMVYGIITNQPAFIFGEAIFVYIYVQAYRKFNSKRDSYREKAADDEETIAQMRKVIKRANAIELEILETRIGKQTKKKLELRKSLQKQLYILLKIGEKIDSELEDE